MLISSSKLRSISDQNWLIKRANLRLYDGRTGLTVKQLIETQASQSSAEASSFVYVFEYARCSLVVVEHVVTKNSSPINIHVSSCHLWQSQRMAMFTSRVQGMKTVSAEVTQRPWHWLWPLITCATTNLHTKYTDRPTQSAVTNLLGQNPWNRLMYKPNTQLNRDQFLRSKRNAT